MRGIFLDIETTGLDPSRHRAIDIAFKLIDLHRGDELGHYQTLIQITPEEWEQKDPYSIEINGYHWEDLFQGLPFSQVKEEILKKFKEWKVKRGESVFICQNPSFDRSFFCRIVPVYTQEELNWPYHWLDFASMHWAKLVDKAKEGGQELPHQVNLSKNAIALSCFLPEEAMPHRAMNGVEHLILCYKAVVGFPESRASSKEGEKGSLPGSTTPSGTLPKEPWIAY
jgi:oligoribonuclease